MTEQNQNDSFRYEEATIQAKGSAVPGFTVWWMNEGKSRSATFRKRLPLGQRIAALESFGQPSTDLGAMGVLACFSMTDIDGVPVPPGKLTRDDADRRLDQLDDDGLEAYVRALTAMNPPREEVESDQKATVGNS